MPNALVKSFAKKANKSVAEVEKIWKEVKEIVGRKWKPEQPQYWALVNHIVQRRLKIAEEKIKMSFKDYLVERETER